VRVPELKGLLTPQCKHSVDRRQSVQYIPIKECDTVLFGTEVDTVVNLTDEVQSCRYRRVRVTAIWLF
jgi:hypothetical protein